MRIALATCSNLPDWEVDDTPLHDAFAAAGVEIARPAWDDDGFDWSTCDACLIRTTWDYQERIEAFMAWAERAAATLPIFNPIDVIRWNTHKFYLRDLHDAGLPIAPTVWLERGGGRSIAALMHERGWTRGFLKPAVGATARETMRFHATDEDLAAAQQHVDRLAPDEDLLLQPYLASVETRGECSAIMIDGDVTHCVRKIPVPGDYRVQDDFGASDEPVDPNDAERRLIDAVNTHLRERFDTTLPYARLDWLTNDDDQPVVNELELVEPSLFFRHGPAAPDRLVTAICRRV